MLRCRSLALTALALAVFAIGFRPNTSAQEASRGQRVRARAATGEMLDLYDESHALVIGVSDYNNGWRRLPGVKSDVPGDGLLLLAFSCHGVERDGRAFLLPSDAQVNYDISLLENASLEVATIKKMIRDKQDAKTKVSGVAQVVALLDACRNDPTFGQGPHNQSAHRRLQLRSSQHVSRVKRFIHTIRKLLPK